MKQISLLFSLLAFNWVLCLGQSTEKGDVHNTEIGDVRISTTSPLIVTYKLIKLRLGDSLAVRFFVDNKRFRAKSVSGDIGYNVKVGPNRQIKWDFTQDGLKGKRNIEAEVFGTRPGIFAGKYGALKLSGLICGVGLGVYSTILGSQITNDVRGYNNAPQSASLQDDQSLNELKNNIHSNKTIFTVTTGLSAALLIVDALLIYKARKPVKLKAYSDAPRGIPSLTFAWFIR